METWIIALALSLISALFVTSQQTDGIKGLTSISRPWYSEWSLHRVAELVDRGYNQVSAFAVIIPAMTQLYADHFKV